MRFNTKPAVTLAAIALAAALSACASKPKPKPGPSTAPEAGPSEPQAPAYQPPAQQPNRGGRPAPGSVQDFVINVGDRVYFDFDSYQVRGDAQPILDQQSAWLSRYPAV